MKAPIVRWGENTRTVSYKARAFDHRGMYLKVNAPTKHTDTPSPRPARPDLYNVLITACRCPRAQCVLPDSLVSRVSQPPALGRLDRRRAHRAQSRGGRASLWSACIPPLPPRPPSPPAATCCYPWARTRPRHPSRASHGLTASRQGVRSAARAWTWRRACSRLARSVRAGVRPSAYPASTLSLLSVEVRPVARRRRFDSRRQQGVRRAVALVLGRVGAHGAGEQLELHAQHLLARLVVHRRRVARREDLTQGAHVSKAVMVEPW